MRNVVLTRWELSPNEKFEKFYEELCNYLKEKLIPTPLENGKMEWLCDFDHGDYINCSLDPSIDPFKHAKYYCEQRRLYWPEVKDMIDEYKRMDTLCDCDIPRRIFPDSK